MATAILCLGCTVAWTCAGAQPLDDPTQPYSVRGSAQLQPPKRRELQVEGIFRRGARRTAIFDGRIVHEGERLANITIEEITADAVRYSRNGHDYIARLADTTLQVRRPNTPQMKLP